jgi:hypothetical protein
MTYYINSVKDETKIQMTYIYKLHIYKFRSRWERSVALHTKQWNVIYRMELKGRCDVWNGTVKMQREREREKERATSFQLHSSHFILHVLTSSKRF